MTPEFEVFTRRMVPLARRPFVTIQRRGTISMNASAYVELGSPDAVELLFATNERIIGIRPATEESEFSYPIRAQNGKQEGPYIVSGTAFVAYYEIDTTVSRRYRPTFEDSMMLIDLNGESTVVTSNRSKKAARVQESTLDASAEEGG